MNLELVYANLNDKNKGINIPPKGYKKHPFKIGKESIKETIKNGDIIKIPVENNKQQEKGGMEI